jgi:RimJ/RimL family protein N-acetyltransferase
MGADFSHVSLSTERRRIREILANDDEYHWVILSRKNAVGSIFIGSIREESSRFGCRAGMLSYLLEKQYRGRGVMSSVAAAVLRWAFHEGGFGAVSARVFPDNTASMQLLGKLGFVADSTESVDAETRERFGHPAWERFLLRGDQYS